MPRYFFHVSGATTFVDLEGRELVDDQEAWSLAVSSTGELVCDLDGGLRDHAEILATVTSETGVALISLRFSARRHAEPGSP
jgi:hypothetical protein